MSGKDYYKILGIEKKASQDEVKKAFKKQAMQHHPDRPGGSEAKFKEVNEAYQVLGDSGKRQQYDQFGSNFEQQGGFGGASWEDFMRASRGQQGGGGNFSFDFGGMDFGDLFGDLFAGGGGRTRTREKTRGRDVQVDVELDFKEAAFGVEKELSLRKQAACDVCHGSGGEPGSKMETCTTCEGRGEVVQNQRTFLGTMQTVATCPTCEGRGQTAAKKCQHCGGSGVHPKTTNIKVKIPAGIDNGQSIRLTGQGEAGKHGSSAGDLYVAAHIRPSKIFQREGFDVYSNFDMSYRQAVLGDTVKVETLDGEISVQIPEGTESGQSIRLRNRGVPHLNGKSRGDHYLRVKIKVPKKVNRGYRKLLEELDKES